MLTLLAFAMLISIVGHAVAQTYDDEPVQIHPAFLFGYNGYIRPNDILTRAEAAVAFYHLLDAERREKFGTSYNKFTDVSSDDWFNTAVSTVTNASLMNGFYDETFRSDESVTRAQFAVMMVRLAEIPLHLEIYEPYEDYAAVGPYTEHEYGVYAYEYGGVYSYEYGGAYAYPEDCEGNEYSEITSESRFLDTYGHWANRAINIVVDKGWATTFGVRFYPEAAVTRVQAAIMLTRMFDRLPECADDFPPDMLTWYDNQRRWGRIEYDSPRIIHDPQFTFTNELAERISTEAIILHHLDSLNNVRAVHNYHLSRGWWGIGYNFQVNRNGTIWLGRGMEYIGAHTRNHNVRTIGIAVQGRFHNHDRYMPNAQFDALVWLLRYIRNAYGELPILGHRDVNWTSCPGRFFPMAEVRRLQFRDPSNVIGYSYGYITPRYWLYLQAASNSYAAPAVSAEDYDEYPDYDRDVIENR